MLRSSLFASALLFVMAGTGVASPAPLLAQTPSEAVSKAHHDAISSRMRKAAIFGGLVGTGVGASIGYAVFFNEAKPTDCPGEPCPVSTQSTAQGALTGALVGGFVGAMLSAIVAKATAPAPVDIEMTRVGVETRTGRTHVAFRLSR